MRRFFLSAAMLFLGQIVWCQHETFFATNGQIWDMAVEGNDLYIAGDFTEVGRKSGCIAKFNLSENKFDEGFPFIGDPRLGQKTDLIYDIISDGKGGFYICGAFEKAGAERINRLAHINAKNEVDPGFAFPEIKSAWYTTENTGSTTIGLSINKLFLNGHYLYVTGIFKTDEGHYKLCRIDTRTNKITPT